MNNIQELLILHHNHIDVGYTHAQEVFWQLSDRFIDEALELCEAHSTEPEASRMHWTIEVTAPVLHWLRSATPDSLHRLKALAKRGQLSFGALFCNMTALSNTEELIESLQPVRMLREELGVPVKVAVNHDVNGLSWSLVGLLHDLGIENLLMGINVHMGGYPLERPRAFFWEDASERRLLVFNGEHYNMLSRLMRRRETDDFSEMVSGVTGYIQHLHSTGYPYNVAMLSATHPAFNDNNPPDRELPGLVRRWNEEGHLPPMRITGPQELFEQLRNRYASTIPVFRGDWVDYWTSGCASSAVEVAVNRRARSFYFAARALEAHRAQKPAAWSAGSTSPAHQPESESTVPHHEHAREIAHAAFDTFAEKPLSKQAWWHMALGNEHTWGAFGSIGTFCPTQSVEPVAVNEQWSMKASTIYKAHALAQMSLRDELEKAAGNAPQGRGLQGILVFNPLPVEKTGQVRIPREVLEKPWFHISSTVHQIQTMQDYATPENAFVSEPYTLGPFERRVVPLSELNSSPWQSFSRSDQLEQQASDEQESHGWEPIHPERKNVLENRWYRMKYDAGTGHVTSLYDKDSEQELLDLSSDWHFFEPVREYLARATPESLARRDARESFYEIDFERWHAGEDLWNPDWERAYDRPKLKELQQGLHAEGVWLRRVWDGPGREQITQTITLLLTEKRVRCEASFHKRDESWPESLYMTFPLNVPAGRVHYDSGATPTEYGREVLPGGCLDWFTVNSWVASHNDSLAVVLAAPDAPLFMAGGWNYASRLKEPREQHATLMLGWVMNNYWNTNFRVSQPGPVRLRYELGSFERFDSALCADFGRSAMLPLQWHPILECNEGQQTRVPLLQIEPETAGRARAGETVQSDAHDNTQTLLPSNQALQLLSVSTSRDGSGMVLRLFLAADAPKDRYSVRFPGYTVGRAWRCSLTEERHEPLDPIAGGLVLHPLPGQVTHVLVHMNPS